MAKRIVAQPLASSQPLPAELDECLRDAAEDNTDLVTYFRGCLGFLLKGVRDTIYAIDQAEDLEKISSQDHDNLLLDATAYFHRIGARWPEE